jgi:hypothetical protein
MAVRKNLQVEIISGPNTHAPHYQSSGFAKVPDGTTIKTV